MFCTGLQSGRRLLLAPELYLPKSQAERAMTAQCSWQGNGHLDGMQLAETSAAFYELISV